MRHAGQRLQVQYLCQMRADLVDHAVDARDIGVLGRQLHGRKSTFRAALIGYH